jgi:hypothetical protein
MTNTTVPVVRSSPVRFFIVFAILMAGGYMCTQTLRFTHNWLNIAFVHLYYLVPILALIGVLRLQRWAKILTTIFLAPVWAMSLLSLLTLPIDMQAEISHRQLSRELSTVQQGRYVIHLAWQETAGGALGPHSVSLEQQMPWLPGIVVIRQLDYFEGASEGSLSVVGANRISLHIPGSDMHHEINQVYLLKPRVYF